MNLVLPIRKLFRVQNSKLAEEKFNLWIIDKDPGYRVRYVFDHEDKTVELSSHNSISVIIAINGFRMIGCPLRETKFKLNRTLLKIRDKLYKGI